MGNFESIRFFYPELILTILIIVIILVELVFRKANKKALLSVIAFFGLLVAFISVLDLYRFGETVLFTGMIALDPFALFFKILAIVAAAFIIVFSYPTWEIAENKIAEFLSLLIAVVIGISLLASSVNLLMMYLAFELVSVPCYILCGFKKRDTRSNEAALKYVIYGAVSTGLMLYGLSLIYGFTGTLDIFEVKRAILASPPYPLALFVAGLLILAGLGYKIAAVPFHFWSPDVYEGAPTPVTAFLSVGPKAAGFAVLIRFFFVSLSRGSLASLTEIGGFDWAILLAVISAVTMTLGNLVAIVQTNLKRLLAYSSIAHAGYILMGVAVLSGDGLRAVLFYLVIYLFMNLGAFLVIIAVADATRKEDIENYRGLGFRAPFVAVAMTVFLFALTGLPPTGGFIGKFYLFAAVIKKEFYWLALVGILNSVISLYYYARIIKAMFLVKVEGDHPSISISPLYTLLLAILIVPIIVFGVYWAPLTQFIFDSMRFLSIS
jgi:NADH-quinone oxidoreductase subunit N